MTSFAQRDGQAIQLYAEAFGRDPEFYAFNRSLEAYRKSFSGDDTQFVLSPNSDFLRYLSKPEPNKPANAK